jgi:hypothetical protein
VVAEVTRLNLQKRKSVIENGSSRLTSAATGLSNGREFHFANGKSRLGFPKRLDHLMNLSDQVDRRIFTRFASSLFRLCAMISLIVLLLTGCAHLQPQRFTFGGKTTAA